MAIVVLIALVVLLLALVVASASPFSMSVDTVRTRPTGCKRRSGTTCLTILD